MYGGDLPICEKESQFKWFKCIKIPNSYVQMSLLKDLAVINTGYISVFNLRPPGGGEVELQAEAAQPQRCNYLKVGRHRDNKSLQ